MKRQVRIKFFICFICLISFSAFFHRYQEINREEWENFRAFRIPYQNISFVQNYCNKYNLALHEVLAVYLLHNDFFPEKTFPDHREEIEKNFIFYWERLPVSKRKYKKYAKILESFIYEMKEFPISRNEDEKNVDYIYSDTWKAKRSYKHNRFHYGTDISDRENMEGIIPIVSMTDGYIENLGWNELGGYRVGIRSENKNYYYYAHFSKINENLTIGDFIKAGDFLGLMGCTGYSKIEGTRGKFPVHLHIGISILNKKKEIWINPYPFLRLLDPLE